MSDLRLASLQNSYGRAVFQAELHQRRAVLIRQELDSIAQVEAVSITCPWESQPSPDPQPVNKPALTTSVWTPEKCEQQAEKSRAVWADPEKRKKIIQSMKIARNARPSKANPVVGKPYIDPFTDEQIREFGPRGHYNGVLATVARSLGMRASHVCGTLHGKRNSARVATAIQEEMAKRGPVPSDRPTLSSILSPEERAQFRPGGRYYGLQSQVADALKMKIGYISQVATGKHESQRVLRTLRQAMTLADESGRTTAYKPKIKPFPANVLVEFERGGRYHAIPAKVASELGIARGSVWQVLGGKKSTRVLLLLRSEIERADRGKR